MTMLKDIKATAIALVDQGANQKTFFLLKRDKEQTVDKEQVKELLKAGELTTKQVELVIKDMSDDDKKEINDLIEAEKSVTILKAEDIQKAVKDVFESDEFIEKAGAKFSKTVLADIKKLSDLATSMKTVLDKLSASKPEKKQDEKEDYKEPAKDKAELKKRLEKNADYDTMSDDEANLLAEIVTEEQLDKEGK